MNIKELQVESSKSFIGYCLLQCDVFTFILVYVLNYNNSNSSALILCYNIINYVLYIICYILRIILYYNKLRVQKLISILSVYHFPLKITYISFIFSLFYIVIIIVLQWSCNNWLSCSMKVSSKKKKDIFKSVSIKNVLRFCTWFANVDWIFLTFKKISPISARFKTI